MSFNESSRFPFPRSERLRLRGEECGDLNRGGAGSRLGEEDQGVEPEREWGLPSQYLKRRQRGVVVVEEKTRESQAIVEISKAATATKAMQARVCRQRRDRVRGSREDRSLGRERLVWGGSIMKLSGATLNAHFGQHSRKRKRKTAAGKARVLRCGRIGKDADLQLKGGVF
ncbi:hypothetical protein V6N13_036535 [Hibiscus sabdariffa]